MYYHGSKTKGIKKLIHDISLHCEKWIGGVLGQMGFDIICLQNKLHTNHIENLVMTTHRNKRISTFG